MAMVLPLLHVRIPQLWDRVQAECQAPLRRVVALCGLLAVLYTLGDYVWYLALPLTSVAEATAIFNSQSIFTFALSVLLLGERVVAAKVRLARDTGVVEGLSPSHPYSAFGLGVRPAVLALYTCSA